jgi:hypothetical protein
MPEFDAIATDKDLQRPEKTTSTTELLGRSAFEVRAGSKSYT